MLWCSKGGVGYGEQSCYPNCIDYGKMMFCVSSKVGLDPNVVVVKNEKFDAQNRLQCTEIA